MGIIQHLLNFLNSKTKVAKTNGVIIPQNINDNIEPLEDFNDTSFSAVERKTEPEESESLDSAEKKKLLEEQIESSKPEVSKVKEKENIEIVIGFDFGTSCSKVILRDVPRNISYAVDFGKSGHKNNTYLLPTQIYLDKSKIFDLLKGDILINEDIKINVIDKPYDKLLDDITNIDIVIAYLGCAFRRVRAWFKRYKGDIYLDNNIIWQINIGIPARDYSNSSLVKLFRYVALLGWEISKGTEEISVQKIHKLTSDVPTLTSKKAESLSIHPDDIYTIPEIIAAVIGYAKSRMRQDGMYFLMDVGASTVDISMFNLFEIDSELKYSILWAELGRYGVLSRFRLGLNALPDQVRKNIYNNLNPDQYVDPIPSINKYLSEEDRYSIKAAEKEISTQLRNLIGNVIVKVKKDRNPNDFSWEKGVPIFITGGGSGIDYYRDLLLNKFSQLSNMNISFPRIVSLPNLEDLEIKNQAPSVIKRFSSAYGLSYRESDIGQIIGAGSIEAISKYEFELNYSDRFISKELV